MSNSGASTIASCRVDGGSRSDRLDFGPQVLLNSLKMVWFRPAICRSSNQDKLRRGDWSNS